MVELDASPLSQHDNREGNILGAHTRLRRSLGVGKLGLW